MPHADTYVANADRTFLDTGTRITDRLTVVKHLSDCGGSSLVYKIEDNKNKRIWILKELFPYLWYKRIYRRGKSVVIEDASQSDIKRIERYAKEECDKSAELCRENESNSSFFFMSEDITSEVLKNPDFSQTHTRYLLIDTKNGYTLDIEKNYTLEESLLYVIKILNSVEKMHDKGYIHCDLKFDNVYFINGFESTEETFCVILDCGTSQKIGNVDLVGVSGTHMFAAPELMILGDYIQDNDYDRAEQFKNKIGIHTDIFSVGAMLFRMLMGSKYSDTAWQTDDDPNDIYINSKYCSLEDKYDLIRGELSKKYAEQYPYLVEELARCCFKALNFEGGGFNISFNRYESCGMFSDDLKKMLSILKNEGIDPVLIAENSAKFIKQYDKKVYDEELLPEVILMG